MEKNKQIYKNTESKRQMRAMKHSNWSAVKSREDRK